MRHESLPLTAYRVLSAQKLLVWLFIAVYTAELYRDGGLTLSVGVLTMGLLYGAVELYRIGWRIWLMKKHLHHNETIKRYDNSELDKLRRNGL